jgi:hypothetical protein
MAWYAPCTKTQAKILALLSDGLPHRRDDMVLAVFDQHEEKLALQMQVSLLRKILRPQGEDILCVVQGYVHYYQHVRLLGSAD